MNINRLLSGFIGTKEAAEPKLVELKVGQVVKGLVLQMLTEQDALVSIAGTPVRARLETPLAQGQATLLQVQPESTSGQIVLKPLTSSVIAIADHSLGEVVKNFGLKDTETNRVILREMHAAAVPLNAKTVQAFQATVEEQPAGVPIEEWTEAAIVALKKGLPLKGEIIAPLHRTLFGKPLTALFNDLQGELLTYLQTANREETPASGSAPLAQKLREALSKWDQLQRMPGLDRPSSVPSMQSIPLVPSEVIDGRTAKDIRAAAEALNKQVQSQPTIGQDRPASVPSVPASPMAPAPTDAGKAATEIRAAAVPQVDLDGSVSSVPTTRAITLTEGDSSSAPADKPPGSSFPQQVPEKLQRSAVTGNQPIATAEESESFIQTNGQSKPESVTGTGTGRAAAESSLHNENPSPVEPLKESWIKSLFKHLGLDYEHKAAELLVQPSPDPETIETMKESIKGLILHMQSDESLPLPLKETLQQTLQNITGQQLLLGADRGTPIAFVTLMVPIGRQEGGSDHAAVQIQSRRNKGGQFDSDNCRLIFDLRMKQMGETLADVHVTNRIVSLQVHNDHPLIGSLLQAAKPEVESALAGIGYSFISMKHLPYPAPSASLSAPGAAAQSAPAAVAATYRSRPYKGVDLRV